MSAIKRAREVLGTGDSRQKAYAAHKLRESWLKELVIGEPYKNVPIQPARPDRPVLVPPSKVPRRRLGSEAGRGALLHAVAHIELNAIDLAADMIARFTFHDDIADIDRADFVSDWSRVCDDEARHFLMICLLYTSPSPRDATLSRMPSSA